MGLVNLTELNSSPLFVGLAAKEIEYLNSIFTASELSEGKTVFIENMPGESLYLIKQGSIKVSQMLAEIDEVDLQTLNIGDIFGEMAVIDGGNRLVRARVVKNAVLYSLHKKAFNALVSEQPRLALQLTLNIVRIFSSRIRSAKKDYRTMLTVSLTRKK